MSQTITVPKPENRLDQTDADFRPLFINWADSSDNYTKHDLFDDFELRQYSVLFWDPLQFAYDHKLRTPDREISTTQYVSYSQSKLVTYFSKTKSVSARLKKYLSGGGVLVIRSNIPRSFIKMMSSSQASNTDYTKAITPVFSWLESLIGKYSMQYFTTKTLNFVAAEDPLQDQFGNSPITCMQSLISIGTGRIEVVAGTGKMSNLAAISKITFGEQPGQIYFVPKFNVQAEVTDLVEAFKKIVNGKQSHTSRPKWLSSFDEILQDNCPHTPHREKLRLEIDAPEETE